MPAITLSQWIAKRHNGRPRSAVRWGKKPRRDRILTARRTIWTSACKRFRVIRLQSLFGLPDAWLFLRRRTIEDVTGFDIITRHRCQNGAFTAANRLAREEARSCRG
jgi:hypothetical protein